MSPLSLTELARRKELEHIIELRLGTFYFVVSALLEIRTVAFIGAPMQRLRIIAVIGGRWLAIMRTS